VTTSRADQPILISPIGPVDAGFIPPIQNAVREIFGFPTRVDQVLDEVGFALHHVRQQFHSTAILDALAQHVPRECIKILGITAVDLFIPILTHVYGEAQLGGRSCIVSTYRLDESVEHPVAEQNSVDRLIKEALHELGHTFNLRHCREQTCIMHYCRSLHDVDRKSMDLCRYCRVLLQDELKRLGLG
jgi:archaemetzincin